MRLRIFAALIFAALGLTGCGDSLYSQQQSPGKLSTGFWIWGTDVRGTDSGEVVDELYCRAGYITGPIGRFQPSWNVYTELPHRLPAARQYWLVYRYDKQGVPDAAAAPIVGREFQKHVTWAQEQHLNVSGVQLDIDSPTGSLPQYAAFLREVKRQLPTGTQISITALLDWFRDGTSVGDVIDAVDEFIPQFYDVLKPEESSRTGTIAKKIDAAEWSSKFNKFKKRFRIGVSTFGRARFVQKQIRGRWPTSGVVFYRDLAPMDIGINPAFALQSARSEAGELVLTYTATHPVKIDYQQFEVGDQIQFTLATPESVRSAFESAKRMTGYIAGVVFFRWPAPGESLAMTPRAVLAAAGQASPGEQNATVRVVNGNCAAVSCVDLFLENVNPLAPAYPAYQIRSSVEFEYFLPEKTVPVRLSSPDELTVSLPPYSGRTQLYLGRAVTPQAAAFSLREKQ